jgi:guanylate kinase
MNDMLSKKIVVFCGPSGAGKTTVLRGVMAQIPELSFYVSATSRALRGNEINGVEYFFLSPEEFKQRVTNGDFLEWEEVYKDTYYGTLKSEIDRIHTEGKVPVSDIDVKGAMHIKEMYGDNALIVFVKTPIDLLHERLISRGTDSKEKISERIARATEELSYENRCDVVIENISLEKATKEATDAVSVFLSH